MGKGFHYIIVGAGREGLGLSVAKGLEDATRIFHAEGRPPPRSLHSS